MKFSFYIETSNGKLTGEQKLIVHLANISCNISSDTVYCISNISDKSDFKDLVCHGSLYDFDYSLLNDYCIIVPANYLIHLLSHLREKILDANIVLIAYDGVIIKKLYSQNKTPGFSELLSLLKKEKSLFFTNRLHYYQNSQQYGYFYKQMLPLVSSEDCSSHVPGLVSPGIINIGYFGPVNSESLNSIHTLCDKLIAISWNDLPIIIHILTDSANPWSIDLEKYAPRISFVFKSYSSINVALNYISSDIDIVVAFGYYAIYAASQNIPVLIPILEKRKVNDNLFVLFSNVRDGLYKWSRDELIFINNELHTINDFIHKVYRLNQKKSIGALCGAAFLEHASSSAGKRYLLNCASTSTLSYRKLTSLEYVSQSINKNVNFNSKSDVTKSPSSSVDVAIYNEAKYNGVQKSYRKKISRIRKNLRDGKKVKVAFLVIFDSVFPTRPVFEKMLCLDVFDPYIVVIPNISRSFAFLKNTYYSAYESLSAQYGNRVLHGMNELNNTYLELGSDYPVVFFSNPYKHLVHKYHEIEYFLDKDVLTIYSNYGFAALNFWDEVISTDFYNFLWRACVETKSNLAYLSTVEKIRGKNGLVTGYIKMDSFANIRPSNRSRKCVMICPHHTVWGWKNLNIGNFLKYADLFLKLPELFPDIDFVFRPHPLLVSNLKDHNVWTQQKIDDYFAKLCSMENMHYDTSGEYFQQFADCDAIIHDCGSYIGECLYTMKPCCYMVKSIEETYSTLVPLGKKCMDQYYHAFTEEDLLEFIRTVVILGDDVLKSQRESFVKKELMSTYPHATDVIIDEIKHTLLR